MKGGGRTDVGKQRGSTNEAFASVALKWWDESPAFDRDRRASS
jgi:hypothetical protein